MTTEMAEEPKLSIKGVQLESRRNRNWFARYSITVIVVATFLILVGLLFFSIVPDEARDLLNILVGAYVAVLAKTTDYWFKEKDDPEQRETEAISNGKNASETE